MSKSSATGGWKGKNDKECFRCGRITHTGAECKAKTHVKGGPPKSATRGKMCWMLQGRKPRNIAKCAIGHHWFGVFWSVVTPRRHHVAGESSEESGDTVPLVSWFQGYKDFKASRGALREVSQNLAMATTAETAKSLYLFGRHEQSDILKQAGPWAQNVSRCVSSAKGCLPLNFPVLLCVSEIGRFRPTFANCSSQYDISSEEETRPDEGTNGSRSV